MKELLGWSFDGALDPWSCLSYRVQILHGSSYGQSEQNTKVLITQPFFELPTPDFAWKFIWTVQSNDKVQKYNKV